METASTSKVPTSSTQHAGRSRSPTAEVSRNCRRRGFSTGTQPGLQRPPGRATPPYRSSMSHGLLAHDRPIDHAPREDTVMTVTIEDRSTRRPLRTAVFLPALGLIV